MTLGDPSSNGLTPVSFRKGRAHEPRLSPERKPGRTHQRYWQEWENDILRQYYPTGGVAACAVRLPAHHTSKSAIYGQARKLGLKSVATPAKRQSHDYGPDMDERIRKAWPELDGKRRGAVNALADELGVPRWWLGTRARKLGLEVLAHKKEPPWTAAEDALMARVPLHEPDKAAAIFREHGFARTPTAIVVRAKRLSLSRRATRKTLSARKAAEIVGFDCSKTLVSFILSGDLKAARRNDSRLPQQGGSAWDIAPADLRQFVIDHLDRIDFRRVDKVQLVDLLVSEPPAAAIRESDEGEGPRHQAGGVHPSPAAHPPASETVAPQQKAYSTRTQKPAGDGDGGTVAPRPAHIQDGRKRRRRTGAPRRRPFRLEGARAR